MPADAGAIVVVTGATGFVGSHAIKQLLESGYRVRGTVRDAKDEKKNAFLLAMNEGAQYPLELFSASLTEEGSFDAALEGAKYCIHTAAAVMLTAPDPQREIIDVTVNGVINVLRSCEKAAIAGTFKRFVHCSSVAAIMDPALPVSHVYTESDNNLSATVARDPYSCSKYLADIAVSRFVESEQKGKDESERFTCALINPGAIYGPMLATHHAGASPQIIVDLMTGTFPMVPHLGFPSVDVRDVAKMHILAMEDASLKGRFVCVDRTCSLREISGICKENYPNHKFTTKSLPNWLMYTAAIFDKRLTFRFLRDNLSKERIFSNEKAKKEMGFVFRDVATTFTDTCKSLIDLGVVPERL